MKALLSKTKNTTALKELMGSLPRHFLPAITALNEANFSDRIRLVFAELSCAASTSYNIRPHRPGSYYLSFLCPLLCLFQGFLDFSQLRESVCPKLQAQRYFLGVVLGDPNRRNRKYACSSCNSSPTAAENSSILRF